MNDSAFDTGERSAFDSWYNGMVGFHINSERIICDLYSKEGTYPDSIALRRWMAVCWNNAIEACENKMDTSDYFDFFESLKEPLDKTL